MTLASALLAVSGAAADNLSVFDPASPPAHSIRNLFYLVLAVTGVIFVLTEGVLLYCIARFRRAPGDTREPPQIYGSKPIEVAWTVAPLLTVFVLFLVVTRTIVEVRGGPPTDIDPLHVTVVGHQWWWEYRYPNLGVTTANELHVEADRPVILELESMDVIHSFWVPRLAGKTDVIPGRTNRMWFQAKEPGVYLGQCAEYCGMQHANMLLIVHAERHDQFVAWLENQRKPGPRDPAVREGRDLFLANACANCHTIRGTVAQGTFGPDLTHLMSRQTLASGMVSNDRDQLRQWVLDPQVIKPGCLMPGMHMSQREVDRIVAYLQTLN